MKRDKIFEREIWSVKFTFEHLYNIMSDQTKEYIDVLTDKELKTWLNDNMERITRGMDYGLMDWETTIDNIWLEYPDIVLAEARKPSGNFVSITHQGDKYKIDQGQNQGGTFKSTKSCAEAWAKYNRLINEHNLKKYDTHR